MAGQTLMQRAALLPATSPFSEPWEWTASGNVLEVRGVFDDPTEDELSPIEGLLTRPTVLFAEGDLDGIASGQTLRRLFDGTAYTVGEITRDGTGVLTVRLILA